MKNTRRDHNGLTPHGDMAALITLAEGLRTHQVVAIAL
jgi:hypothetical protein